MRGEPLAATGEAHVIGRRRAHVHLTAADRLRQPLAHLFAVRRDLRLLADQHAVRVDELPTSRLYLGISAAQQVEAVGPAEAVVTRREEPTDVAEPGGAEHRVDQRVREHVAVGVPGEAPVEVEPDAAEDERRPALELVRVDADPDAEAQGSTPGNSSSERMTIASSGDSCRKPHGPRTTCTAVMPAASAGSTS